MRPRLIKLATGIMGLLLVGAMVHLLWLRYQAGDVYPRYSTLRPDPLGSKALYDTLNSAAGIETRRWIYDLDEYPDPLQATLWVSGYKLSQSSWMNRKDWEELEAWIKRGGRMVVSFRPLVSAAMWEVFPDRLKRGAEERRLKRKKEKHKKWWDTDFEEKRRDGWHSAFWEWGMEFSFEKLVRDDAGYMTNPKAWKETENLPLDNSLALYTGLRLTPRDKNWQAIYTRQGDMLAAKRKIGTGEVIVWADGYWLSNEALRQHRPARLISWLQNNRSVAVFSERHHGIRTRPGIADLLKRLNLEAAAGALLLAALLFVWRSARPLVPPEASEASGEAVVISKEDAAASLARLIRRSLSQKDLLKRLLEQWKLGGGFKKSLFSKKSQEAEQVLQAALRDPEYKNLIRAYDKAANILKSRRK